MEIIPVTDSVRVEVRDGSFTIATNYPWSDAEDIGQRNEFAMVKYEDLPALIRRLFTVMAGHCPSEETEMMIQTVLLAAGHVNVVTVHSAA